jgi:hypothetical protein
MRVVICSKNTDCEHTVFLVILMPSYMTVKYLLHPVVVHMAGREHAFQWSYLILQLLKMIVRQLSSNVNIYAIFRIQTAKCFFLAHTDL